MHHMNKLWIDWQAFYIAVWFYWILSTNIYYVHALLFKLSGERKYIMRQQGVCCIVALPFTLQSILRQKKNCGNSNISIAKT